jgi:hypothetical protein
VAEESTSTNDPGTPGAGGGVPAGYVPQADLEAVEAKRRGFQAEVERLKAQLASATAAPTPTPPAATSGVEAELAALKAQFEGLNPSSITAQVVAGLAQREALVAEKAKLRDEFKSARADVFDASYETPEEMRAAVEASHKAEAENIAAVEARVRQEMAAQMKELHGVDLAPAPQVPATSDANGDTGPSTIRDLASMPFDKLTSMSDEDIAKALART